jgi:hypothetical protein
VDSNRCGPFFADLAAAVLLAAGLRAPAAAQPVVEIPRVDTPPRLEDYLDGQPRPEEAPVAGLVQREPGDGVPSSEKKGTHNFFGWIRPKS